MKCPFGGVIEYLHHFAVRPLFLILHRLRTLFRWKPRASLHGAARFMDRLELSINFNRKNKGLVLSSRYRMSEAQSFQNLCLIAPPGLGKSTRFIIPNVLAATGSVVITDPSGEIYQNTAGHLAARGYTIQVFQPATIGQSLTFNPLTAATTPKTRKQLATTLAKNTGGASGDDTFWIASATSLLFVLITAVARYPEPSFRHLGNVRLLLNHFGVAGEGIHEFMANHLDAATFAEYRAFCASDTKTMANILSTARVALDLWSDPDIAAVTSTTTLDVASVRERPTAVYIIVPEHQVSYFAIIVNLLCSAFFEHCIDHADEAALPVYFLLDEFGNIGTINNFAKIVTTLRKRRGSLSIILQHLAQLEEAYGPKNAKNIFGGGMVNKLFFSGLDLDMLEYLERLLGTYTKTDEGTSTDNTTRTIGRSLMSVDEIRTMPADDAILIPGRHLAAKLSMRPFSFDPRLKKLASIPPPAFPASAVGEAPMLTLKTNSSKKSECASVVMAQSAIT